MENNQEFGMTEEDVAAYKRNSLLLKLKYYLSQIEPIFAKILQTTLYLLARFFKASVGAIFRMIMGKDV